MYDGVESNELGRGDVSNVAGRRPLGVGHRTEITAFVPAGIEPEYLVSMVTEERHEHRSDISAIACDEHPHSAMLLHVRRTIRTIRVSAGIRRNELAGQAASVAQRDLTTLSMHSSGRRRTTCADAGPR